ncbi:MAG: diguanylate cyclase [Negativicutes bacterium]|nr:diguanylate cyclase [Negativicutes bacterium]MDR3592859.1 diguanylate cyclase [Negativicutes bacterium]
MDNAGQLYRNWLRPNKSILLFCTLLLIMVWSATLWQIDQDRKATIETVMQDGDKFSRAFEEHVRRVLKTHDQYLLLMKKEYEGAQAVTPALTRLMEQIGQDPLAIQLAVEDKTSYMRASLRPAPAGINFADLPHFKVHAAADSGLLFIGRPFSGRVTGIASIPLSRRLNKPDGSFDGIVYASLNPEYFNKFYRDMAFDEHYVVRVLGLDGYARASNTGEDIGLDMSKASVFEEMPKSPAGFYPSLGQFLGKRVLMSYRLMPDYPLIVQVGVAEDTLLPMLHRRNTYIAAAAGSSLLILAFTASLIGGARRRRLAEQKLQESFAELNNERSFTNAVLESVPGLLYLYDAEGHLLRWNKNHETVTGYSAAELSAMSLTDWYWGDEETMARVTREVEKAFQDGVAQTEANLQTKDGGKIPFYFTAVKMVVDNKPYIVGIGIDVTEQKKADEKLRQKERLLLESFEELTASHEELTATEEELRNQYDEVLRVNEKVSRQKAVLSTLHETALGLMSHLDAGEELEAIAAKLAELAGTEHVYVYIIDKEKQCAVRRIGKGIYAQDIGRIRSITQGLLGEVVHQKKTVMVEDYSTWDKRNQARIHDNIHADVQVPLIAAGEVIGTLGMAFTSRECCFSENDVALIEQFALVAAIALDNARKMRELQASQQTTEEIFNAASDGFVVNDRETGDILAVNRRMTEMFGYSEDEFKQQGIVLIASPTHLEEALSRIHNTVNAGIQLYERHTTDRLGHRMVLEIKSSPAVINGKPCCLALMRDVTTRKLMEERIEFLSLRDPMTSAYNRTYFEEKVLGLQTKNVQGIGIFVCDVDGLKLINDTLGHRQGDELLKKVVLLLQQKIQEPDFGARIGGDEFAIILHRPTKAQMEQLDQHYRNSVIQYNIDNPQLPLSLSIGWALGEDGCDIDKVFKEADNNMYRQKMHQSQSVRGSIVQTMMKALEEKDDITEGHAERLGNLMEIMGQKLGLPQGEVADLRLFAKFHDIGKVGIPDDILKKPGKLTEEEMTVMRRHCEIGFRIAKSSPDLAPIADWILKHQEHWSGNGYPLGISGEEIPIQCRILGIVDAYDAMTRDRPYRKAMSKEDAIAEIIRCSGSQFDPTLAALFVDLVQAAPN